MKNQVPKSLSPMEYAMKYLTARDRTVSEMENYLDEKEFGEADVDATIERLKELGLLDDARYAKRFVETRLASKPISRRHLWEQLKGHGLSDTDIDEALKEVDSEEEERNARMIAEKYARQFRSLEPEQRRERVLLRLTSRGFSYDVSRKALESALSEENEWSES